MTLIPIVEGHSEQESVPVLLRRLLAGYPVARPFRIKRGKIVQPGEIERSLVLALADRPNPSCVVVIIDADDDCPAELGPRLLERCKAVTNLPVSVVLANREIEAWFLGGIESLRGHRGIRVDAVWEGDPEGPRGAKGRLEELMVEKSYVTVDDQPALMSALDVETARTRCRSLDKLLRDLDHLLDQARRTGMA